jgi:hypothetical protein
VATAFLLINKNDSIVLFENRMLGTGFNAWWVVAVHAGIPEIQNTPQGFAFVFQHPVPLYARSGQVFLFARYSAGHAAGASIQVKNYSVSRHDLLCSLFSKNN